MDFSLYYFNVELLYFSILGVVHGFSFPDFNTWPGVLALFRNGAEPGLLAAWVGSMD